MHVDTLSWLSPYKRNVSLIQRLIDLAINTTRLEVPEIHVSSLVQGKHKIQVHLNEQCEYNAKLPIHKHRTYNKL